MSDIWHTTKEKPMLQRDIILCGDGWSMAMDIIPETVNNICWKNVEKWCYVDDLIKENDRTRKALEIAVDALKKYTDASGNWWYGYEFQGHYEDYAGEYADKALEQITALEQKDK